MHIKIKMAARADTAASLSPDRTVFLCFLSCKSQCFCTYSSRLPVFKRAYSREFLLDVGRTTFLELNSAHAEELWDLGLLRRPTPSPTPTTASRPQRRRYKRRERKQKRGKRGGIRARLAANPHKPAIPTIELANVRSLDNKLDYWSAAIREETAESPGEDQQTEGQLHPSGCQEAELPPVLAPPPLSYTTHHWTLTPPPHHHHYHYSHTHTHHTHTHTHTHTLWSAPVTLYSIGLTSFNYLFWQSE